MSSDTTDGLYYRCHVFCCANTRPQGHPRGSCGGGELRFHMKERAEELGLDRVRINSAGCLGRCDDAPVVVVYPQGIWYRCASREDADQVLTSHIRDGKPVEHLMLGPGIA